jgi:PIN domain nuclease of toxin-antitoxin system
MEGSKKLGRRAKSGIFRASTLWISAATVWEMAIKVHAGRLDLKDPLEESIPAIIEQGVRSLPVSIHHALAIRNLPLYHRDPFDRMLIAQAQCEDLTLVSADSVFARYDVRILDASL